MVYFYRNKQILSSYFIHPLSFYEYTREIPAFVGISLALQESGAFGATVGVPLAPIWETAANGGGERKRKKLGCYGRPLFRAPRAPRSGRQLTVPSATKKKNSGASGAPFRGHLRRPKWF